MQPFSTHDGIVAPLDRANVDTDQIIPKQFLKSIHRTGFGDNLFDAWRFLDEGEIGKNPNERRLNHDFILNAPRYQAATILLARDNFGCGSSREHAVWALQEYGFRCAIAPSFADIFLTNSFKNGFLPIVLNKEIVEILFVLVEKNDPFVLSVDLESETVLLPDGESHKFHVDPERKHSLINGLDDIGLTLEYQTDIGDFEKQHRARMPWVFRANSPRRTSP